MDKTENPAAGGDLFGGSSVGPARQTTLWGEEIDALAREAGGWPESAIAYALEVVGHHDAPNPMVLIEGGTPIGYRRDGRPQFGSRKFALKAGVKLSEYRAAIAERKARLP